MIKSFRCLEKVRKPSLSSGKGTYNLYRLLSTNAAIKRGIKRSSRDRLSRGSKPQKTSARPEQRGGDRSTYGISSWSFQGRVGPASSFDRGPINHPKRDRPYQTKGQGAKSPYLAPKSASSRPRDETRERGEKEAEGDNSIRERRAKRQAPLSKPYKRRGKSPPRASKDPTSASTSEARERDENEVEGDLTTRPRRVTRVAPLSIPYTTPASEFLFGTSVVLAALRSMNRKLYQLYIYSGENRESTQQDEMVRKLAQAQGVKVKMVSDGWRSLMDKMSSGRPHNVSHAIDSSRG